MALLEVAYLFGGWDFATLTSFSYTFGLSSGIRLVGWRPDTWAMAYDLTDSLSLSQVQV